MFNFFKRKKQDAAEVQQLTDAALEKTRNEGAAAVKEAERPSPPPTPVQPQQQAARPQPQPTRPQEEERRGGSGFFGRLFDVDDITDQFWDDLEEILIKSDLGYNLTQQLIERSQRRTLDENTRRSKEVERIFRSEMIKTLQEAQDRAEQAVLTLHEQQARQRERERQNAEVERKRKEKRGQLPPSQPAQAPVATSIPKASQGSAGEKRPYVILVVGVNGSGKTTSIAKLAQYYKLGGASVVLGAGDTFRAGAINQLKIWGERVEVPVVALAEGSDPSAVAFNTVRYANENQADIVIVDTAGRIQTNFNLMDEMKKIERTIEKAQVGAPNEILLVLEAVTGQNGLSQAKNFTKAVGIDGIVLTKLDGTAKGGIAFAIANELKIPIKYIGTGEKVTDFAEFDPTAYVNALFRR